LPPNCPNNMSCAFLVSLMPDSCSICFYSPRFDHANHIWCGVQFGAPHCVISSSFIFLPPFSVLFSQILY
jgi:hypothetical protein